MIVPILHSEAEMGSLAPAIRDAALDTFGQGHVRQNAAAIILGWAAIRSTVMAWKLPWDRVRLYQDGLPICGREPEIVETLAVAGSANHQLLLDLMRKGAVLMGTESADLVTEEYHQARESLAAISHGGCGGQAVHAAQSARLLRRRDQYIAKRIEGTLRPEEIGILFIGLLHSVEPYLPDDMLVSYPIRRPNGATP